MVENPGPLNVGIDRGARNATGSFLQSGRTRRIRGRAGRRAPSASCSLRASERPVPVGDPLAHLVGRVLPEIYRAEEPDVRRHPRHPHDLQVCGWRGQASDGLPGSPFKPSFGFVDVSAEMDQSVPARLETVPGNPRDRAGAPRVFRLRCMPSAPQGCPAGPPGRLRGPPNLPRSGNRVGRPLERRGRSARRGRCWSPGH